MTSPTTPGEREQKQKSARVIADVVTRAKSAKSNHSCYAIDVATLTRDHINRFGEEPELRGLVVTFWPVVLVAQPVGRHNIVTRYIIEANGAVSLSRK